MLEREPATDMLGHLVEGVRDDQLTSPTPCAETSLGDLLDHVDGFLQAFTAAALKTAFPDGAAPSPTPLDWAQIGGNGSRLGWPWPDRKGHPVGRRRDR